MLLFQISQRTCVVLLFTNHLRNYLVKNFWSIKKQTIAKDDATGFWIAQLLTTRGNFTRNDTSHITYTERCK